MILRFYQAIQQATFNNFHAVTVSHFTYTRSTSPSDTFDGVASPFAAGIYRIGVILEAISIDR